MKEITDYNKIVDPFTTHKEEFSDTDTLWMEHILNGFWEAKVKTVLDYWCWDGKNAKFFADHWFTVLGVDISDGLLEKTHEIKNAIFENIKTNPEILNGKNFDACYSSYVTCTIPIKEQIVDIFSTIHSALRKLCKINLQIPNCKLEII